MALLKMVCFFFFFFFFFSLLVLSSFGLSDARKESYELPTLHDTAHDLLEKSSLSAHPVNPPPKVSLFSHETITLVSPHLESTKKVETLGFKNSNVPLTNPEEAKPRSRKLSSIGGSRLLMDPFPARPNPLPKTSDPPLHSSVGISAPANVARNPQPKTASPAPSQTSSPPIPQTAYPPVEMYFPPEISPTSDKATPPSAFTCPPCSPVPEAEAPAPEIAVVHKLWCVAKPTVPADTLQEAVDYACGAGGADCQEIMPTGNCYYPDSAVAHASYAFNSYWQKNKRNGGTCSFGGTAMLINSDPSYQLCRFVIT